MLMFNWFAPKVFNQGYLPEEDGHQVFFMEAGSKDGKPVLVFHGGPGGASRLRHAEAFDRRKFRVVFFDQRGCGRSQPSGETAHNTTADLLHDAARLLDFLDIKEKVILLGGSWGATLALLFAEKYPERVKALLLSKIFLADEISAGWTDDVSGWFYPDVMDKLRRNMPENANLPEYYAEMVNSRNLSDQVKAASLYGNYERVLGQLVPAFEKKEVTLELAEQALKDIISPDEKKVITPEYIISVVAEHYGVTPADLSGNKRNSKIVMPRQVSMYLCREIISTPLKNIGKALGNRDHTTVMHGIEKIENELQNDDNLKNTIDILKKKINPQG